MTSRIDLRQIGRSFEISGAFRSGAPLGSGHIHETFVVEYAERGAMARYVHQRINDRVFREPAALMENVERVLAHLHLGAGLRPGQLSRRVLTLVPARDGRSWARDREGGWWRTWLFIDGALSPDRVEDPRQACEAAQAFGLFQRQLLDLPGPRLHETIPRFHDTPARLEAFRRSLETDALNRAASVTREIEFALARETLSCGLTRLQEDGLLEERVIHNDTKLNNVLFDAATGEALCVIDLDTVMPGLGPCDFGDLVRTAACRAEEDEPDTSLIHVEAQLFEALARGYLKSLEGVVPRAERESLVLAAEVIAFECGLRFLTDYLEGDPYFRVGRERHNVDRCRAQFALVRSLEKSEDALRRLVERL